MSSGQHAREARFWAEHIDALMRCLPRMLRNGGDERCARLVRDVLAELKATQGDDAAVCALDRLSDILGGGRR